MISVVIVHEAYGKPAMIGGVHPNPKDEYSVWIVPGTLDDFETSDGQNDIDQYLTDRGVQIESRLSLADAESVAKDISTKFSRENETVQKEFLSND